MLHPSLSAASSSWSAILFGRLIDFFTLSGCPDIFAEPSACTLRSSSDVAFWSLLSAIFQQTSRMTETLLSSLLARSSHASMVASGTNTVTLRLSASLLPDTRLSSGLFLGSSTWAGGAGGAAGAEGLGAAWIAATAGGGEADQLQVVVAEHEQVIMRAEQRMPATIGRREAEPAEGRDGAIEVANGDDGVIDALHQAVVGIMGHPGEIGIAALSVNTRDEYCLISRANPTSTIISITKSFYLTWKT